MAVLLARFDNHHGLAFTEPARFRGRILPEHRLNGIHDYITMLVGGVDEDNQPVETAVVIPVITKGQSVPDYLRFLAGIFTEAAEVEDAGADAGADDDQTGGDPR